MKDEKYLNWIRKQPCMLCNADGSQAHHCGSFGTAKRNYDEDTIPLCYKHHKEAHKNPVWSKEVLAPMATKYRKKYLEKK